jgi:hypothetical protein
MEVKEDYGVQNCEKSINEYISKNVITAELFGFLPPIKSNSKTRGSEKV